VKQKWIEDHLGREAAVAKEHVGDAETSSKEEQEDMRIPEKAGSTTRKPKKTVEEMLNAIRDNLSNLASSDNEEDGENTEAYEKYTELSKLSDDDEPGWVTGIISKRVQHLMESIQQQQLKLDKLMQLA